MDIDIMNVNDPPTGALAIVGEPKAGVTLSLDFSGVADADGLPAVMDYAVQVGPHGQRSGGGLATSRPTY